MMISKLIISVVIFVPVLCFGGMYKWVDEKGQVHFSQTAPAVEQKLSQQAIKIKKSSSGLIIEIEDNAQGIFCGKVKLKEHNIDDASLIKNIKSGLPDWRSEEIKARKYLMAASKSGNKNNIRIMKVELAEETCRVKWARSTLYKTSSNSYLITKRINALEEQLKIIIKERDETCPMDAKFYGKSTLVGDEARMVMKCYNGFESKIKDLKIKNKKNKSRLSSERKN